MNPFEKMNAFNKANPEAKEIYRQMQQWQVLNKPENGVFCPSSQLYPMSIKLMQAVASGLINKRNTFGIYRIDKGRKSSLGEIPYMVALSYRRQSKRLLLDVKINGNVSDNLPRHQSAKHGRKLSQFFCVNLIIQGDADATG